MQINLKDNTYSALKTLAANQSKSVETFLEELIKSAAGKHQPTLIRDTRWATIYDTAGNKWQPRFDADITDAKQDELDRLRAREDVARNLAIAKHRRDLPTNDADKAYAAYVERLRGKR